MKTQNSAKKTLGLVSAPFLMELQKKGLTIFTLDVVKVKSAPYEKSPFLSLYDKSTSIPFDFIEPTFVQIVEYPGNPL